MDDKSLYDLEAIRELGDIKTNENAYAYTFFFERVFIGKEEEVRILLLKYWSISLIIALLYCIAVFVGQRYMRTREPYNLQLLLALWSGSLAVFSILGTVRVIPEAFYIIRDYGVRRSLCHPCYYYGVTGFWSLIFTLSKVVELGDTFFVVARKQRLNVLHWYHHATVLLYVFFAYPEHAGPGRWFCCMNFFVHSFMYSYYTLRALKIRLPRQLAILITSMQILQMIVGNTIFLYLMFERIPFLLGLSLVPPKFCQLSNANVFWGFVMYFSYLILFIDFFNKTYLSPISAIHNSVKKEDSDVVSYKKSQVVKKYD